MVTLITDIKIPYEKCHTDTPHHTMAYEYLDGVSCSSFNLRLTPPSDDELDGFGTHIETMRNVLDQEHNPQYVKDIKNNVKYKNNYISKEDYTTRLFNIHRLSRELRVIIIHIVMEIIGIIV